MSGANESELDEARFTRLLEAYGADQARWPTGERMAAQRHLSSNATAQRLLASARELDLALAAAAPPPISAGLESRVLADFDRLQRRWSLRKSLVSAADIVWPGAPLWQPAAVFGLALAVGIAVAIVAPPQLRPSEETAASVFALDAPPDADVGQDI
jgi:hypothetical protein